MITSMGLGSAEHRSCINVAARLHTSQPHVQELSGKALEAEGSRASSGRLPQNRPLGPR